MRPGFLRVALAAALAAFAGSASAQDVVCSVASVSGSPARLERGARVAPLAESADLLPEDRISTGPAARAVLDCDAVGRVIVSPSTRIEVVRLVGGDAAPGLAMRLLRGAAGFLTDLAGGARLVVETPSAVAAVRSTEWALIVEDGATAMFVREGAVSIRGASGQARLSAALGIDVSPDGALGPMVRWGAPRVEALDDRLGPAWR